MTNQPDPTPAAMLGIREPGDFHPNADERTSTLPTQMNCMVFAGGGAKAAYGAGAAKAILGYHKIKPNPPSYCYIGTSAGALNACVLAAKGPDELFDFWSEASKRRVLGWWSSRHRWRHLAFLLSNPKFYFTFLARQARYAFPFAAYSNASLRSFLTERLEDVNIDLLKRSNLIICTTNFSTGALTSFYVSELIDRFKQVDDAEPQQRRRLIHFKPITSTAMLIKVLLASTAIPLVFPPVEIDGELHIDGGVGNNIPSREAAYFMRFLLTCKPVEIAQGDIFCITLDAPGKVEATHRCGVIDILSRTYNIFEYIHMRPILDGWSRINREVTEYRRNRAEFQSRIAELSIAPELVQTICDIADETLKRPGGSTPRIDAPIHLIEPSNTIGDLLNFDSKRLTEHKVSGYKQAVGVLRAKEFIDEAQSTQLLNAVYQRVNPIR